MARRREPRPPELVPCPDCKLLLERGTNPKGVAWHECRSGAEHVTLLEELRAAGELDTAKAKSALGKLVIEKALADGSVQQLANAMKALGGDGRKGREGGSSVEYERWRSVASSRAA